MGKGKKTLSVVKNSKNMRSEKSKEPCIKCGVMIDGLELLIEHMKKAHPPPRLPRAQLPPAAPAVPAQPVAAPAVPAQPVAVPAVPAQPVAVPDPA